MVLKLFNLTAFDNNLTFNFDSKNYLENGHFQADSRIPIPQEERPQCAQFAMGKIHARHQPLIHHFIFDRFGHYCDQAFKKLIKACFSYRLQ